MTTMEARPTRTRPASKTSRTSRASETTKAMTTTTRKRSARFRRTSSMDDAGSLRSLGSSGRGLGHFGGPRDPTDAGSTSSSTLSSAFSEDGKGLSQELLAILESSPEKGFLKSSSSQASKDNHVDRTKKSACTARERYENISTGPEHPSAGERRRSLLGLACQGRPSVLRLSLRGSPCAARLLLQRAPGEECSQLQSLLRLTRSVGLRQKRKRPSKHRDIVEGLFGGSPSCVQIFFGFYCKCTKSVPSLAQMAFGAPRGVSGAKASIFRQWLSNLKVEQERCAGTEQDRAAIIANALHTRDVRQKSLLGLMMEGEEHAQNEYGRASLFRLLFSGSPALASVCLERRQSAPQLALKVLRILCEGEVSEGESLARMLVSLSATCKGDGQQQQQHQQQQQQQQFSLAHFLLMGEDEGKPSLLRLLLLANEDGVALIPASLRTAVAERLLAPDTRLEGVSQALRHWIRENNLASAGFPDMVRVAYEFLAEICVEMAMPDSGDTAEAEAIRLVLLGNGTTVEPLHRVLLWRDESGLFEILTLLAAGFVVGLELQTASPGQQHVLLRRWQERLSRAGELLEETAHAPFAWAQTAIRTARALGPGGVLETRFVEISIAMASSSEPVHARAERAAQALFAGLDKDPVLAAQWDAHLASVMREVSSPGMGIVLDAARSRAWPAAARAIQALPGNFSLSGFAQQVEDLATYMMDALRT